MSLSLVSVVSLTEKLQRNKSSLVLTVDVAPSTSLDVTLVVKSY